MYRNTYEPKNFLQLLHSNSFSRLLFEDMVSTTKENDKWKKRKSQGKERQEKETDLNSTRLRDGMCFMYEYEL